MPIELANIQLDRVHKVDTLEHAALVHHQVPGLEGNLTQNLGRDSVRLQIEGIFYGKRAEDELETLRKAYKARKPVDFLADVVGQAYFSQVVLETFEVGQAAQAPGQFSYRLIIAEYVPVKKSAAQNKAAVNSALKLQAEAMVEVGSLPDALKLGSLPNLSNPAKPLTGAMEPIGNATTGLDGIGVGFTELSDLEVSAADSAPTISPNEPSLDWVKELSAADLSVADAIAAQVQVFLATSVGWVTLQVEQSDGSPLNNTTYQLVQPDGSIVGLGQLDEQGQAQTEYLAAGDYRIRFPDLASEETTEETSDATATGWVVLQVEGPDGVSLSNATYQIIKPDGTVTALSQLDGQGHTQLENLAAGDYRIRFPELETTEGASTESATGWVVLQVEGPDGVSLSNATYQIIKPDGEITALSQLDGQGQAQLANMLPGDYRLRVSLPSVSSESGSEGIEDNNSEAESIGNWVLLSVEDGDGELLRNVTYQVVRPDGRVTDRARLSTQGQALIDQAVPGEYVLQVFEPYWIEIVVTDADGEPMSGQSFEWRDSDNTAIASGQLSEEGTAAIELLQAGVYSLVLPGLEASDWRASSVNPSGP